MYHHGVSLLAPLMFPEPTSCPLMKPITLSPVVSVGPRPTISTTKYVSAASVPDQSALASVVPPFETNVTAASSVVSKTNSAQSVAVNAGVALVLTPPSAATASGVPHSDF